MIANRNFGIPAVLGYFAQALRRRNSKRLAFGKDRLTALAEGVADVFRDAGDLECPVLAGQLGGVAKLFERIAQGRAIDRADHRVVTPDFAIVQRAPFTAWHPRHIRNDRMDMALRVERAARVVLEQCIDQVASPDRHVAAIYFLAPLGKVDLGPAHRPFDRRHIRFDDPLVAADQCDQRCGLGHRESQIDAQRALSDNPHLGAVGELAVEDVLEGCRIDLAAWIGQRKIGGTAAIGAGRRDDAFGQSVCALGIEWRFVEDRCRSRGSS